MLTQFWIGSVIIVSYLINRTPSKVLQHDTPYFRLYNCNPVYNDLRVFGCLAFDSTLSAGRSKFAPRAKLYVFIVYPSGIKWYKFLDFHTHEIFIFVDINFHGNVFPFRTSHPTAFHNDPFDTVALPKLDHPTIIEDITHPLPIIQDSHTILDPQPSQTTSNPPRKSHR